MTFDCTIFSPAYSTLACTTAAPIWTGCGLILARLDEREKFRLEVCGEVWNEEAVRERIRSYGIENLVRLRGHVSDAELDAALDAADLALNLRNPTMGEASLSQLQIWDHALPSLVTRLGWYAALPKEAVDFVRP